jgi:CRP-like cAMP-binding protein
MTKKAKKVPFDPKVFLATVNGGLSISKYRANQKVFSQGLSADAVFYIQKGKVKITVTSEQGKEAVVAVRNGNERVPTRQTFPYYKELKANRPEHVAEGSQATRPLRS